MARFKRMMLAFTLALALAMAANVWTQATHGTAQQIAGSNADKIFGRESPIVQPPDEEVQTVAGSKAAETFGRESPIVSAPAEEVQQVAGSNADKIFGRESS